MILKLALRNLTRNRGRVALHVGLVAIASGLLVFALGQIGGVKKTLSESAINTLTGHLQIKPRQAPIDFFQYESSRRLSTISGSNSARLMGALKSIEGIEAASPRIRFGSLIGDGEQSKPAMIMAVDPLLETKVCPDLREILAGMNAQQDGFISAKLAEKLSMSPGQKIVAFAETPSESLNLTEYHLAGLIQTPVLIDEFVQQLFLVPINSARELLYLEEGTCTEIAVRVSPKFTGRLNELRDRIQEVLNKNQLGELEAYTYRQVESSVENIGRIAAGMGVLQVGAIIVVMLISILIITLITLHERRFEIGTLMSIGMAPNQLIHLFLTEVAIKTLLGYLVGTAVAILALLGIRAAGGYRNEGIWSYVYGGKIMLPTIDLPNTGLALVLLVCTVILVCAGICARASRQSPVVLLSAAK